MKLTAGQTVVLTGASGGLGTYMTHAFADYRVNLALVAHPGAELENLRRSVEKHGCQVMHYAMDLRDAEVRRELVQRVHKDLGSIDILVNNAGIEFTCFYHQLTEQEIRDVIEVNLAAPLMLTRFVLPEMLERKQGHIVNISSLAGKSGPALQEPYAATKAALIAFTSSVRSSYRGSGVSASVVTPGFVEAGIYSRLKAKAGPAPALLGTSRPERVAKAVVQAIQQDRPEIVVNSLPVRPLFAFAALFSSAGERLIDRIGANDYFRRAAKSQKQVRSG
jgi:short-subunit dehydrogenase